VQLKVAVDELGFHHVSFHAIFHDLLNTVKRIHGRVSYDWHGIDLLYDDVFAKGIKPFVEVGVHAASARKLTADNLLHRRLASSGHTDSC
jgi:beta-xylosidase